jgi:arabinogalactan endo-1,4-beta-galactosidase
MAKNGNVSETANKGSQGKSATLHPLHEAALKLAGMGLTRSQTKTRDLVAMLLGHGARAWRASQPDVKLHLHVTTPQGAHPVRLRLR